MVIIHWLWYHSYNFHEKCLGTIPSQKHFHGPIFRGHIQVTNTIVLCLDTEYAWDYSSGLLVIQYGIDGQDLQNLTVNKPLFIEETKETVILEQFSEECYR